MRAFMGKAYETGTRYSQRTAPAGFDSIYAPGTFFGDNNSVVKYPEMIVFKEASAIPSYVIHYTHKADCKCTHCG